MPFRGKTGPLVKLKKTPTDPCILCSVKQVNEPVQSFLPRCNSDISNNRLLSRPLSSSEKNLSELTMGPPLFDGDIQSASLPKSLNGRTFGSHEKLFLTGSDSAINSSVSRDAIDGMRGSADCLPTVVRRVKGNPESTQKRNRRRGIVWSGDRSNLISAPIGQGARDSEKPRTTAEQQELLRKLADSPPKSDTNNNERKKGNKTIMPLKNDGRPPRHSSARGKMAVKIQRTIRALYDGGKRGSFDKLAEEEDMKSNGDEPEENHLSVQQNSFHERSVC